MKRTDSNGEQTLLGMDAMERSGQVQQLTDYAGGTRTTKNNLNNRFAGVEGVDELQKGHSSAKIQSHKQNPPHEMDVSWGKSQEGDGNT